MIKVKSNMASTSRQLNRLLENVRGATRDALQDIYTETIIEVADNKNWSSDAVYKDGPQKGQKYDLTLTGQLMETITDSSLNTITAVSKNRMVLGIGNIPALDSLRSGKQGSNPDGRYWRLVVYGRAAIPGWTFVTRGETWGVHNNKWRGVSIPDEDGVIASSEPTYMFENGLAVASRAFPRIVSHHIRRVV